MRGLLPLLVTLAALSGAGTALAAAPGPLQSQDSAGRWHYRDERVANNPLLDSYVALSYADWRRKGYKPCERPTVRIAPNLGKNVAGRGDKYGCDLWIKTYFVARAQGNRTFASTADKVTLCVAVRHEVGHLAGLDHTDHGIMGPGLEYAPDSIAFTTDDRRVARAIGYGPCGRLVARQFNKRPLPAFRLTSNGRFDSIQ